MDSQNGKTYLIYKDMIDLTLYSPIQSQELREKLGANLNFAMASVTLFHSSSTMSVTRGTSTLYGNYREHSFMNIFAEQRFCKAFKITSKTQHATRGLSM